MTDVSIQIREAYEDVAAAELPDSFAEIAFRELLRAILTGSSPGASSARDIGTISPVSNIVAITSQNRGGADWTIRIGEALGVAPETVLAAFDFVDGELRLVLPTKMLPPAKAEATREVALVLAAANDALELETRASSVRSVLEEYGLV